MNRFLLHFGMGGIYGVLFALSLAVIGLIFGYPARDWPDWVFEALLFGFWVVVFIYRMTSGKDYKEHL